MDEYLTTAEVAERLGVSHVRVRQFVSQGRIPSILKGKTRLIRASDVHLIESRGPGGWPKGKPRKKTSGCTGRSL